MSTTRDDGGPAYPRSLRLEGSDGRHSFVESEPGMSLRDWFAGAAVYCMSANISPEPKQAERELAEFARNAFRIADAMIAERNKP